MFEETTFNGIEAVKVSNEKGDELTVLTGVGPRIISYKTSEYKKNFFYINERDFNNYNKDPDSWHIFGGTRIWLSPETKSSYIPDNDRCRVFTDEKNGIITVHSESDSELKIIKKMSIQPLEKSFKITYSITNTDKYLSTGGIWVLSCLLPMEGFKIYIPWGELLEKNCQAESKDQVVKYPWSIKEIKFWESWLGVKTKISSKQWKLTDEFFIIDPTGETGKVGLKNIMGFAIYTNNKFSFIKYSPYIESAIYPDDGCSFEFYTSKDFYEIETLSPIFTLKPFKEFTHTEIWWAGEEKIDLSSISSAARDVKRLLK